MSWSIGVDTGGTFTDLVALNTDSGEIRTTKVASTPEDPSLAVLTGLRQLKADGIEMSGVSLFAHGTTVSTNSVIQRKGAQVGLLITAGTNAVYLARRSRQSSGADALDANFPKPPLLVPARRTKEISERIGFDGRVVKPLDEATVLESVESLVNEHHIQSIAVCYLFSYANPDHERRTRELIRSRFPGIRVSLSSDVLPIIREYRRLSTTVLDAFVGPVLENYLGHLEKGLKVAGVTTPQVFIMQSNGGLMSIDVAKASPVQTLLSGPAAGVIAGKHLAELTGTPNVVTFDVGGTSTDIATIIDGHVAETSEGSIAGYDASVLMNEISTIGAGGGTIARIGPDGRLKVGPDSAGANPGPACYGLNGEHPTVTDANIVLGYLDAKSYLGGRFPLKPELARAAIEKHVAQPMSIGVVEAAVNILKLINSAMEGELRVNLMQRGHDPRSFGLVAIGGGGPLHATTVAQHLGFDRVIVPPYPGLGSAAGLLMTDVKHQYIKSSIQLLDEVDGTLAGAVFAELMERARADAAAEGGTIDSVDLRYLLDMRYQGQGYELTIPCGKPEFDSSQREELRDAFHRMHERVFGHRARGKPIEIVNFRMDSTKQLSRLSFKQLDAAAPGSTWAAKHSRQAYFEAIGKFIDCPVYDRWEGRPGHKVEGPAIIEQTDTTILVLPNQVAEPDQSGVLIIRPKSKSSH